MRELAAVPRSEEKGLSFRFMRPPRIFGWLVAALVASCGAFRAEVAPDGGGASADAAGDGASERRGRVRRHVQH